MFARLDEKQAMTLQDIKETKRYGRTHRRTHRQRENSIPTTNKVCGGGVGVGRGIKTHKPFNLKYWRFYHRKDNSTHENFVQRWPR